jgi:hypothetical protein
MDEQLAEAQAMQLELQSGLVNDLCLPKPLVDLQ